MSNNIPVERLGSKKNMIGHRTAVSVLRIFLPYKTLVSSLFMFSIFEQSPISNNSIYLIGLLGENKCRRQKHFVSRSGMDDIMQPL